MTDTQPTPEGGRVADAVRGNWVDSYAPPRLRPFLRLSRADRPIGTWLLLIPCWWAVLLAASSATGLSAAGVWVLGGCAAGAWLMRGAGCTWNDIADRDFDAQVARTRSRPIPSGQVSVRAAAIWMCLQSLLACGILLSFDIAAIVLGIVSLGLVCVYPFAKRFTWWPQVFLGLAFNWGAVLAWAATTGTVPVASGLLFLSGIAWTLFYDTIYAHQDKEDDAMIGVKSTARLFGADTARWLRGFAIAATALMAASVIAAFGPDGGAARIVALLGVAGFGAHLLWQLRHLRTDDPETCLWLFRSNRDAGLIPALFFAASLAL